uniref:Uncharacterized protein n=1 Tax=Vitis vinifera TaxID=29760 RepID=A5B3V8_VITVI|nr:hypothetical protein VITISV_041236 [Vitis vinifera]
MESRVVHIINNTELFVASIVLSSQLRVAHGIHSPKLFIAFKSLSSRPEVIHVNHNLELFIVSKDLSFLITKAIRDVRTGRPDTPSEGSGIWAVASWWNDVASSFHQGRNSIQPTFHLLLIFNIWNSVCRHFTLSGYLTSGWERRTFQLPRSDMSGSSDRIFHIRCLTLDGRGGHFNFLSQTCPDPLIALTWRVFLSVYSAAVFS